MENIILTNNIYMSGNPNRIYINGYYRRPQDSASNFTVNLPTQIINPKAMSLKSAVVPLLAYNIPVTDSIFYFQTGDNANNVYSLTLNTAKVYNTAADFISEFSSQLAAVKAGTSASLESDGRITIRNTAGVSVIGIPNREYNWNSTYFNNAANKLGFYNGTPDKGTIFATTFTGSAPFTLIRTTCIFVSVDVIAGDSCSTNSAEQTISTILFQIPITNPSFGGINSITGDLLSKATDLPYSIYNINVRLLDDNFDDLDLLPSAKVLIELAIDYENSN